MIQKNPYLYLYATKPDMKKLIKKWPVFILLSSFLLIFTGCENSDNSEKKQLLVYCGITMIRPMTEIKEIIEKQENCQIEITKGGSGNLLKSIEQMGVGDLYLPGSDTYIFTAQQKDLIADTVCVGHNRLAMMVKKGNPLHIENDIKSLLSKDYYVVIGNPRSGSVGKATKALLVAIGIFEEVEQNAIRFTTDSKDLVSVIKNNEADLVINWYATYTWDDNSQYLDIIDVPEMESTRKKLLLAQLKSSRYPEIARKFMDYAQSQEGQAIFEKYGLK